MLLYDEEKEDTQRFIDTVDRELAEVSGTKNSNAMSRLRSALTKEDKAGTFGYNLDAVKRVCTTANCTQEYTRLLAMLDKTTGTGTSSHPTAHHSQQHKTKMEGKEKRLVATWVLGIGATSERFTMLKDPLDTMSHRTIGLQKIVSNIGIGRSKNTKLRKDATIIRNYDCKFSEHLQKMLYPHGKFNTLGNPIPPKLCLRGDDDLTAGSAKRVFRNAKERCKVARLTMIAIKVVPEFDAPLAEPPGKPLRNPDIISIDCTVNFLISNLNKPQTFFDKCVENGSYGTFLAEQVAALELKTAAAAAVAAGEAVALREAVVVSATNPAAPLLFLGPPPPPPPPPPPIEQWGGMTFLQAKNVIDSYLSLGNQRNRLAVVSYALQSKTRLNRNMRGTLLQKVLNQKFTSYINMITSMLTTLRDPHIFALLEYYAIPDFGDNPKTTMQSKLGRQVHQPEGPAHLGKLAFAAVPKDFVEIMEMHGMADLDQASQFKVMGQRLSHIVQFNGTLHGQDVNLAKYLGTWFLNIFIKPLFERTAMVKCPTTMHIRQLRGLLEALFAGMFDLIPLIREILEPFKHRFDVDVFMYFATSTLPLVGMLFSQLSAGLEDAYYSGVCYAEQQAIGNQRPHYSKVYLRQLDQYLFYKRTDHPLHSISSDALHHNFEFIETNVNSIASAELQNMVSVDEGIKRIYKKFYPRMDADCIAFKAAFSDEAAESVLVSQRRMDFMVSEAIALIYEITERLVNAQGEDLPYRVEKGARERQGFTTDAWICLALTGRYKD